MDYDRKVPNSNNTSGYLGVNWSKEKKKWHAKLGIRGKRIHLGYFHDPNDAALAYKRAKRKYKGVKR